MNKLTKLAITSSVLGVAYMASDRKTKNKVKKDSRKIMKHASMFMDMF